MAFQRPDFHQLEDPGGAPSNQGHHLLHAGTLHFAGLAGAALEVGRAVERWRSPRTTPCPCRRRRRRRAGGNRGGVLQQSWQHPEPALRVRGTDSIMLNKYNLSCALKATPEGPFLGVSVIEGLSGGEQAGSRRGRCGLVGSLASKLSFSGRHHRSKCSSSPAA